MGLSSYAAMVKMNFVLIKHWFFIKNIIRLGKKRFKPFCSVEWIFVVFVQARMMLPGVLGGSSYRVEVAKTVNTWDERVFNILQEHLVLRKLCLLTVRLFPAAVWTIFKRNPNDLSRLYVTAWNGNDKIFTRRTLILRLGKPHR